MLRILASQYQPIHVVLLRFRALLAQLLPAPALSLFTYFRALQQEAGEAQKTSFTSFLVHFWPSGCVPASSYSSEQCRVLQRRAKAGARRSCAKWDLIYLYLIKKYSFLVYIYIFLEKIHLVAIDYMALNSQLACMHHDNGHPEEACTRTNHKNGVSNSFLHKEKVVWYLFGQMRSSIRILINWLVQNPDASSYVQASCTMVQAYT